MSSSVFDWASPVVAARSAATAASTRNVMAEILRG
jgi:hypothetical protein